MPRKDIVGQKYGKLLVIEFSHRDSLNRKTLYKCKCDCGVEKIVANASLKDGTQSCGCINPRNATHGMTSTKVYKTWKRIKSRCFNTKDIYYNNYGGIGIKMDEKYVNDFPAFYKEVGDPPENTHKYSIDRIDNNKGYTEGNLRWADFYTQARNKGRDNRNTSGITGVTWFLSKYNTTYAIAFWKEFETGNLRKKAFSTRKYGLLESFKLACDFRVEMIRQQNSKGADYTTQHGTIKKVIYDFI
jgi:hypothetical protein